MGKKKFFRKSTAILMTASLAAAALAGCGNSKDSGGGSSDNGGDKESTIHIRVMNEFKNIEKVVSKYEELTADDPVLSKIKLDFSFVAGGDYKDKLNMAVTAQEDYDLMFCGSWHGLTDFVQDGAFADLSGYFNNSEYPGLEAAFSDTFTEAMKTYVKQEDGSYKEGIYGINLASYYEDTRGIMYREDLRQKYNCAPITDEDSLMAFVQKVAENEPDMVGLSMYNFFRMDSPWYSAKHDNVYTQDNVNLFGDQTWIYVGLSEDGKTVQNAVVAGDPEEEFAKMPEGYQYDFITEYTVERTKWNPYMFEDRANADAVAPNAAATYCVLSGYESAVKTAQEAVPGSEYGFYVIDDSQRNMEEGSVICDMVTNNWLVVPEWSEKKDQVMAFLDWMFGTQEAHDLFQYGIEGEDWEAVGEDGYKAGPVSEEEKYTMPDYSFTLNPTFIRQSEFVLNNGEIKQRVDYEYAESTYQLSPLAGFVFDSSEVETQIANISALSNELQLTMSMYDADEAVEKINTWHAEAEKVGLEEVRQELISQLQAFLDYKYAE